MITFQGERVYPDGKGTPSLYTIGVALGRIPRFCGHTREWYPVLAHVLTVATILPDEAKLAGLLHDAPEACMGDVPTPWKTEAARRREHMLLRRIYQANGLDWPISHEIQELVDWADRAALAAEAHVLGHPAADEFWADPDPGVMAITEEYLKGVKSFLRPRIAGPIYEGAFSRYAAVLGQELLAA